MVDGRWEGGGGVSCIARARESTEGDYVSTVCTKYLKVSRYVRVRTIVESLSSVVVCRLCFLCVSFHG